MNIFMEANTSQTSKVFEILQRLNIEYTLHKHPPVYTVDEAQQYAEGIDGLHCKNLFLRDQKGNQHFLVVTENLKTIQIKELGQKLGRGNLSFASSQRLLKYLCLEPGSVSPFGLINDIDHEVVLVLDLDLKKSRMINFHPNDNHMTLTMRYTDFEKFVQWTGNKVVELKI